MEPQRILLKGNHLSRSDCEIRIPFDIFSIDNYGKMTGKERKVLLNELMTRRAKHTSCLPNTRVLGSFMKFSVPHRFVLVRGLATSSFDGEWSNHNQTHTPTKVVPN